MAHDGRSRPPRPALLRTGIFLLAALGLSCLASLPAAAAPGTAGEIEKPAIDRAVPEKTRTATFALG